MCLSLKLFGIVVQSVLKEKYQDGHCAPSLAAFSVSSLCKCNTNQYKTCRSIFSVSVFLVEISVVELTDSQQSVGPDVHFICLRRLSLH